MSGPVFHCDDPACDYCYNIALDYELSMGYWNSEEERDEQG